MKRIEAERESTVEFRQAILFGSKAKINIFLIFSNGVALKRSEEGRNFFEKG